MMQYFNERKNYYQEMLRPSSSSSSSHEVDNEKIVSVTAVTDFIDTVESSTSSSSSLSIHRDAVHCKLSSPPSSSSSMVNSIYPSKYDNSFTESETSASSSEFDDEDDDENDCSQLDLEFYDDLLVSSFASLATAASTAINKPAKKSVKFSTVQVREYSITLGDHPIPEAYPLSLDWTFTPWDVVPLREYEEMKRHEEETNPIKMLKRNNRKSKVSSLTVMQRRIRLTQVGGIHPSGLLQMERERIKKNEEEMFEAALRIRASGTEEDEYDEDDYYVGDDDCASHEYEGSEEDEEECTESEDCSDRSLDPENLFL